MAIGSRLAAHCLAAACLAMLALATSACGQAGPAAPSEIGDTAAAHVDAGVGVGASKLPTCEMTLDFVKQPTPHKPGRLIRAQYLKKACGHFPPHFVASNSPPVTVTPLDGDPYTARVTGPEGVWEVSARSDTGGGRAFLMVPLP